MFLIASVLVFAFSVYAYVFMRVAVLDQIPLPIFGLLLVSSALAVVQICVAKRRWVKLMAVLPILLCGAFVAGVLFMAPYDEGRPVGPAVGQVFPVQHMPRATDGQSIPVGVARAAGRQQLVLLFRGFW